MRAAAARIAALVPATPVLRSPAIDEWVGARVHLKAEHLHATGAFKLRGATNAVLLLTDEEAARGVVAHTRATTPSALAAAARRRGIACTVVIPRAARAPSRRHRGRGRRVVKCAPTLEARAETVAAVLADTGAVEIHPFDDPRVHAGQGTAALELLEAVPAIGMVVAPVSGGGLLSGTAIAAHGIDPTSPSGARSPPGPTTPSGRSPRATSCSTGPATPSPTASSPSSASGRSGSSRAHGAGGDGDRRPDRGGDAAARP